MEPGDESDDESDGRWEQPEDAMTGRIGPEVRGCGALVQHVHMPKVVMHITRK